MTRGLPELPARRSQIHAPPQNHVPPRRAETPALHPVHRRGKKLANSYLTKSINIVKICPAMQSTSADPEPAAPQPSPEEWELIRAVRAVRFGSVEAVVHERRLVEIIQRRRTRFPLSHS
jgi:hypothetical protein